MRLADLPARRGMAARFDPLSDPDAVSGDRNGAHRACALTVSSSLEGKMFLRGQLDAEGGETVTAALDAAMGGAPAADDTRSKDQRRADALVEIARHYLGQADLSQVHGHRPQLTAVVEVAALLPPVRAATSAASEAGSDPSAVPARAAAAVRPPEFPTRLTVRAGFTGGWPITPAAIRRIACDARVSHLLTWGESKIFDLSREAPTVSAAQHRALELRDGGCVYPGCDRPPSFCDGHHLVHWIDGGPTELDNLVLQCGRHHRRLHEEGETLYRDDIGTWRIRRADADSEP
ncbi:HNH endonuclease signature motif containing protein [Frankia sp. CIT1]|nr:HNH endonuclease signature motif containing protein [Frankia sp. CIT1]